MSAIINPLRGLNVFWLRFFLSFTKNAKVTRRSRSFKNMNPRNIRQSRIRQGLTRIKKYIIEIRGNPFDPRNPRAINIDASLRYIFSQRVKKFCQNNKLFFSNSILFREKCQSESCRQIENTPGINPASHLSNLGFSLIYDCIYSNILFGKESK